MNKLKSFLMLTFSILIFSCEKDVLNRLPDNKINANDVFKDQKLSGAYLANLYSGLNLRQFLDQPYSTSDEATSSSGNSGNSVALGTVSSTNEAYPYWDYSYIRNLNSFIEQIKVSSLDQSVKTQFEAEARFLRAFVYFKMEKRYGGVPLVDVVINPFEPIDQKYTKRSKEEEVVDFIDTELSEVSNMLSTNPLPKGKINKWTALALKARALLWAASISKYGQLELNGLVGIPSARTDELYKKAVSAATEVVNSGNYSLYNVLPADKANNYRHIFLDESNSEVIFEVVYDGVNKVHSWDCYAGPGQFSSQGGTIGPTLEFVMSYENIDGSDNKINIGKDFLYPTGADLFKGKDPRLFGTIFLERDKWLGDQILTNYVGIDPNPTPDPSQLLADPGGNYKGMALLGLSRGDYSYNWIYTGFFQKKYLEEKFKMVQGTSQTNWIEFRLAEMYLIIAESQFELGELQKASDALNATRERAGISLVDEGTITLDKVRNERKVELFFENHRYWDLRRWRIAESVLNHRFQGLKSVYHYESGKYYFLPFYCEDFTRVFKREQYYNPITNERIGNNPDLIENPLY